MIYVVKPAAFGLAVLEVDEETGVDRLVGTSCDIDGATRICESRAGRHLKPAVMVLE